MTTSKYETVAIDSNGAGARYSYSNRRAAEKMARHLVGIGYLKAYVDLAGQTIAAWAQYEGRVVRVCP